MNLGPGNCRKPFMRKVYCPALLKHADISQEVKAPCFFPRDMITAESRRNSHAVYTATGRAHFFLMGLGNMHDIYFFLDFSSFFLLSSLLSPLSSPIPGSLFSRFTLSLLHFLFLSFSFTFSTFFSSLFPSLTRAHLQSAHPSNFPSFPIYLTLPPPSASLFPGTEWQRPTPSGGLAGNATTATGSASPLHYVRPQTPSFRSLPPDGTNRPSR